MATDQSRTPPPDAGGPLLTRRSMLKATAGSVAAAGAATQLPAGQRPVGDAEAVGPVTGTLTLGAVVFAGGAIIWANMAPSQEDVEDTTDLIIENEVHSVAEGVAGQRSQRNDLLQAEWIDKTATHTPYADAAWSQFETAAAIELINGNSVTDAKQAARKELYKHYAVAKNNAIQYWNAALTGDDENSGLMRAIHLAQVEGTNQLDVVIGTTTDFFQSFDGLQLYDSLSDIGTKGGDFLSSASTDAYEFAGPETPNGRQLFVKRQWPLPQDNHDYDPSNLTWDQFDVSADDWPIEIFEIPGNFTGSYDGVSDRNGEALISPFVGNFDTLQVTHPDRDTINAVDLSLLRNYFQKIDSTYTTIKNDLSTWVETLDARLAQGAVDPVNVISRVSGYQEFANVDDKRGRWLADMAFSGMGTAEWAASEIKVSHPDLAEDLWGDLFLSFDGDSMEIKREQTIQSSEYNMAFFGYYRKDNGEYETRVLSGDRSLDVLDIKTDSGVESADPDTSDSGNVVLWDGDGETPEIFNGTKYNSTVLLEGPNGTMDTYTLANTTTDNQTVLLDESTSLESVERVRVVPSLEYDNYSYVVDDPSNPNIESMEDRIQHARMTREQIEELIAKNSGPAVPGFGIPGVPTLPDWIPGEGFTQWLVVGGAGLAGLKFLE